MPAVLLALLPTLLSALVPVLTDGVRGAFNWLTGSAGANPANVQEAVQLMQAETERLKALAALDTPAGGISQWVADLRAGFRYIGAAFVIVMAPVIVVWTFMEPTDDRVYIFEFYMTNVLGPIWGFLYGQRLSISLKRRD